VKAGPGMLKDGTVGVGSGAGTEVIIIAPPTVPLGATSMTVSTKDSVWTCGASGNG
jgi:hypothetical protein